jgi:hypothetical protein
MFSVIVRASVEVEHADVTVSIKEVDFFTVLSLFDVAVMVTVYTPAVPLLLVHQLIVPLVGEGKVMNCPGLFGLTVNE